MRTSSVKSHRHNIGKAAAVIKPSRKQILLFTVAGFGPTILMAGILLLGAAFNLSLVLSERDISGLDGVLLLGGVAASFTILLILLSIGCRNLFFRTHSGIIRFVLLYLVNLLIAFMLIYLFVRILGGASMAVVDGAVNSTEVRRLSFQATLPLLALAQLAIIPWVLITSVILNRHIAKARQQVQPLT